MSTDVGLGFRSFTRCAVSYYLSDNTLFPIALLQPPTTISVDPGITLGRIATPIAQTGETTTALKYPEDRAPVLSLSFGFPSPDIDQMIFGRVIADGTSVVAPVYFEVVPTGTTVSARTSGQYGYEVTEAAAGAADAICYKVDQSTGHAVKLDVVDYTTGPSGDDEIAIGANLALKLSANLEGATIRGITPATYATLREMKSTPINQVKVDIFGVNINGTYNRHFGARFCSLNFGTPISNDPDRAVNVEILPDALAPSGLGYTLHDIGKPLVPSLT